MKSIGVPSELGRHNESQQIDNTQPWNTLPTVFKIFISTSFWPFTHFHQPPAAKLLCPSRLEADSCELGELKIWCYTIANHGTLPLQIKAVRKTCACVGIEVREGSNFSAPQTIVIQPGQSLEARTRFVVTGQVGSVLAHRILLQTNDPEHPEYTIDFNIKNVTGGLLSYPAEVDFGQIVVGDHVSMKVQLFDSSKHQRQVIKAECSQPHCRVELKPITSTERTRHGRLVGELTLSLAMDTPGDAAMKVQVAFSDDQPILMEIPVRVCVRDHVIVSPSRVLLPRNSEQGSIDRALVSLRSLRHTFTDVKVINAPDYCDVNFQKGLDDQQAHIHLQIPPEKVAGLNESSTTIQLQCTLSSGLIVTKEVQLLCRRPVDLTKEPASPSRK